MNETIIEGPGGQKYLVKIEASGEVRDAEGNVVNPNVTLTGETVVSEAEIVERMKESS
jgi:hypothetical protein